jgi:hypothetical protein
LDLAHAVYRDEAGGGVALRERSKRRTGIRVSSEVHLVDDITRESSGYWDV